jgi:hypothetical protein
VQVIPGRRTESWIAADAAGCKDELPTPLRCGVGELPLERIRHHDTTKSCREIRVVQPLPVFELTPQRFQRALGQQCPAVFLTLPATDDNLAALDVDILDAQLETFLQPQPRPVEQRGDQPAHSVHLRENGAHF